LPGDDIYTLTGRGDTYTLRAMAMEGITTANSLSS